MAQSKTDIANFALGILGSKRITDITDGDSKSARYMNLFYDQARQEVLRRGHWNWAMKRVTLSQHDDAPEYGWSYQYPLPGDFIRLSEVNEVTVWDSQKADFFELELGHTTAGSMIGQVLLTDQKDDIRIRYISDVESVGLFDALFINALSTLLASKAARAITGSDRRQKEILMQFEELDLPASQQVDGAEVHGGSNPPFLDAISGSYFVRARGTYGLDARPDGPTNPSAFPTP